MKYKTTQPPKNIIISHVYSSDNKGDAALTSVLIQDLKREFPGSAITILKLDCVKEHAHFEGVLERPGFMHYALGTYRNPLFKLFYTIYLVCATLIWAIWLRTARIHVYLPPRLREIAQIYERADLIVPVGGGYIRSRKGLFNRLNVFLLLHPLLFGYLLGKPTVLYPQSVGPFQNRLEERAVAFVLKRMMLILLREDTSVALLARLGVVQNVERAIDSGFLLQSKRKMDLHKKYNIPARKLIVGVTVRTWLSGNAQTNYEKAVANALDNTVNEFDVYVIFIPQVTAAKGDDDRIISRRVHGYMNCKTAAFTLEDEPDHHDIKAIYDGLDVLLGTRFHSVIFSLTSFVPVLAIEYEHKTSGIMHDLDLEQWVMKIEDVTTAKLTYALQSLLECRDLYASYLQDHLPRYIYKAQQTSVVLAERYYDQTKSIEEV